MPFVEWLMLVFHLNQIHLSQTFPYEQLESLEYRHKPDRNEFVGQSQVLSFEPCL